jgi:hypothetical protein
LKIESIHKGIADANQACEDNAVEEYIRNWKEKEKMQLDRQRNMQSRNEEQRSKLITYHRKITKQRFDAITNRAAHLQRPGTVTHEQVQKRLEDGYERHNREQQEKAKKAAIFAERALRTAEKMRAFEEEKLFQDNLKLYNDKKSLDGRIKKRER